MSEEGTLISVSTVPRSGVFRERGGGGERDKGEGEDVRERE